MQTFLPFESFTRSACVLDNKRLNKQRIEARQIYEIISKIAFTDEKKIAWRNHPAVLMWTGIYNRFRWLGIYHDIMILEWKRRGFENKMEPLTVRAFELTKHPYDLQAMFSLEHYLKVETVEKQYGKIPIWLGDERLHSSHRANLLRKNPSWYSQFGWYEKPSDKYWWPTKELAFDKEKLLFISSNP